MQHKPSLPQSFISSYREDQRKTKLWTLYSYGHHNKTGDKRDVGPKKSKSKMYRISASMAQKHRQLETIFREHTKTFHKKIEM